MKLMIASIIFLCLSCSSPDTAYQCYIKQFKKKQVVAIDSVRSVFLYLIEKQHPNKTTFTEQFKAHAQHIVDPKATQFKISRADSLRILNVLVQYQESGFPEEFRKWESINVYPDGLHFEAMRNCIDKVEDDTTIVDILRAYDEMGDIEPGSPLIYIARLANEKDLNDKMLLHIYLLENFIPMYLIRFEIVEP